MRQASFFWTWPRDKDRNNDTRWKIKRPNCLIFTEKPVFESSECSQMFCNVSYPVMFNSNNAWKHLFVYFPYNFTVWKRKRSSLLTLTSSALLGDPVWSWMKLLSYFCTLMITGSLIIKPTILIVHLLTILLYFNIHSPKIKKGHLKTTIQACTKSDCIIFLHLCDHRLSDYQTHYIHCPSTNYYYILTFTYQK